MGRRPERKFLLQYRRSLQSGNGVGLYVANTASSDATAVFTAGGTGIIIKGFGAGGEVFDVYNSGDVYGKSFNSTSDRNAKKDFSPVNPEKVLAKVAALPITEWQYKVDPSGIEHLGPMAQDFHAAFGLNGGDDKHISVIDEGGVALAAIQGLNQKLEQKLEQQETEITKLNQVVAELNRPDAENARLQTTVAALQSQLEGRQKAVARLADKSAGGVALNSPRQEEP